jgi:tetrahydromethanopterin S-methyltransferase subunit G
MAEPSPEIIAVATSIVSGSIATLVGLIYRNYKRRLADVEDASGSNTDRLDGIESKVDTLFSWAFGNEEDSADRGISQDIDDQFSEISDRLRALESENEKQHEEVVGRLNQLIDELHDEEALEFKRDDIE